MAGQSLPPELSALWCFRVISPVGMTELGGPELPVGGASHDPDKPSADLPFGAQ